MADLTQWHTKFTGGVKWRVNEDGFVEINGSGIERSGSGPKAVWDKFGNDITATCKMLDVPIDLIVACICTESLVQVMKGNFEACREEPGYLSDEKTPGRVSFGVMQTLLSTAQSMLPGVKVTRKWLSVPVNSIRAGAMYIRSARTSTTYDPPLVAAAYNAGGVYQNQGKANRWKLRCFPIGTGDHIDRFVRFYNESVAMRQTLAGAA